MLDLRRQRGKIPGVGRLTACRDGEQRPPVESVLKGDDAAFLTAKAIVGIFTRQLERRLIGLSAGVTEEDPVGEGGIDKHFGQTQDRLIGVAVAGMPEFAGLVSQGLHQTRMGVPQRVHGDAAGKIDILFALLIPQPRPGAPHRNKRRWRVDRHHPFIKVVTRN
ncbi:uncharacterized protein BN745_01573 [Klebsiella variicola CAG:634]|nr:uncharacterized protein BN745_01573 [Klebsiella variicola CAG:634]